MEIDQGYRWNVPLVTYGFTPEFVEFFGTNGVAAVESAAAIAPQEIPPGLPVGAKAKNLPVNLTVHGAVQVRPSSLEKCTATWSKFSRSFSGKC